MKKNIVLFVVVVIGFVLLAACAPVANQFVELPNEIQASITGLIIAVVGLAFDFIIGNLPGWLGPVAAFLRAFQREWALALSAALIAWLQNALPTGLEDVSIKGVAFLLALIFAFVPYLGARRLLVRRRVRGFVASV